MKNASIVLVLNVGSSSLKFGVYDAKHGKPHGIVSGSITADGNKELIQWFSFAEQSSGESQVTAGAGCLKALFEIKPLKELSAPYVIGHRIVHGGLLLRQHCVITAAIARQIKSANGFAPLHIPRALRWYECSKKDFPGAVQVACLDTAFHRHMPASAKTLPLPKRFRKEGIERFGFHGLSCESIVHQLKAPLPKRLAIAHVGSGVSVTAVKHGRSIDTTMGLTPMGGCVMATRSGDLDPGVLLYLLREKKLTAKTLERVLENEAGLLGLSEIGADIRDVEKHSSEPQARLAIEQFAQSLASHIAAMIISLRGIDLLVFTGGVGEHAPRIRKTIIAKLRPLIGSVNCKVMGAEENDQMARLALRIADRKGP